MSRKKIHFDKINLKLIGSRIKSIRDSVDLNQDKFGESIGISQGAVSDIETGKIKPTKPILLAIQYRYSINPEEILTGKGFCLNKVSYPSLKDVFDSGSIREAVEEYPAPPDPVDQIIKGFTQLFNDQKKEIKKLHETCEKVLRRVSDLEEQLKKDIPHKAVNHKDITEKSAT